MENKAVYKFKTLKNANKEWIEEIVTGALFTPDLYNLNDPFESMFEALDKNMAKHLSQHYGVESATGKVVKIGEGSEVDDALIDALFTLEEVREMINQHHLKPFSNKVRVQCLTRNLHSIPMWAYYTNEFNGIAFEYSEDDINSYVDQVKADESIESVHGLRNMNYDDDQIWPLKKLDEPSLIDKVFQKYSDWKHEEECRVAFLVKDDSFILKMKVKPRCVHIGFKVSQDDKVWLTQLCNGLGVETEDYSKEDFKTGLQWRAARRNFDKVVDMKVKLKLNK